MKRTSFVLILALFLSPASAQAQRGKARARKLFQRAEVHFSAGEFQQALELYREAFKIKPLPGFLFNLGQCHRRLDQCDKALFYFRRYLHRLPDAPNSRIAEELIKECERRVAREEQAEAERTDAKRDVAKRDDMKRDEAKRGETPSRREELRPVWFWATAGAAAALVLTGAITGGLTLGKSREFNDENTDPARRQELKDAAVPLGWTSNITFGLGAAAAAAAGVLYFYTDWGDSGENVSVTPTGVIVQGRF